MSIKALFLPGQTDVTVNGLHQWDRGQKLEIHAADLPALVEVHVHFACAGMDMAVVRSCAITDGVGTVEIPDQCLEQASPIMAWVYELDGSAGMTTKTIVLNVMERARPSKSVEDVPPAVVDKYTEAITAMNAVVADVDAKLKNTAETVEAKVVKDLNDGNLTVAEAKHAKEAEKAGEADEATKAFSAEYSAHAGADELGKSFASWYLRRGKRLEDYVDAGRTQYVVDGGILSFRIRQKSGRPECANVIVDVCEDCISSLFCIPSVGTFYLQFTKVDTDGLSYAVNLLKDDGNFNLEQKALYDISYKNISAPYSQTL